MQWVNGSINQPVLNLLCVLGRLPWQQETRKLAGRLQKQNNIHLISILFYFALHGKRI